MSIEIKVPMLPESVADATVLTWYKKPGEMVKRDENLVDLETDKVVLEVPAPSDGILEEIFKSEGTTVKADEVLARLSQNAAKVEQHAPVNEKENTPAKTMASSTKKPPVAASPAARRLLQEHDISLDVIEGKGKQGRIQKEDVLMYMNKEPAEGKVESPKTSLETSSSFLTSTLTQERIEKRVPMSRLRARIAERLLSAKQNTAMLTTFNEINLKAIMDLRNQYKDVFEKKHGVKLGFMSFFTKATVEALKQFPAVNASIEGDDIIYHGYYDVGIAVSSPRGLVVPILRNVDAMSLSEIEKAIADYSNKAREAKLSIEEMTGGTFTISNGGVFGSLLSTPILNPPQSAILGMHKIEERPVVEKGEIVIRPMMYVALSYDHRIIDGKESVSFLVTIKNYLEDPSRLLLDV